MRISSKYLLTSLAAFVFVQGLGTSFFGGEILVIFSVPQDSLSILIVQMLGALQLGWGMLNYMCRNNKYGGIFGRPLLLANLAVLVVSGMAILRVLMRVPVGPFYTLLLLAASYWSFALLIFKVIRNEQN